MRSRRTPGLCLQVRQPVEARRRMPFWPRLADPPGHKGDGEPGIGRAPIAFRKAAGMRLRELEIFNALMKARTRTGTAELLAISQPAVSKALKHRRVAGVAGGDLLFSHENPTSGIAMKLVEQVRATAAEMTLSMARLAGLPEADAPGAARVGRRRATNGLACDRGARRSLRVAPDHPETRKQSNRELAMKLGKALSRWAAGHGPGARLPRRLRAESRRGVIVARSF